MSRASKFFVFRPWVEPSHSNKTNGDRLPLLSSLDDDAAKQRNTNIKLAWFFSVFALLFLLVNHLGRVKNGTDANLGPDSTALVSLTLSPPVRSSEGARFSVRFRLSNRGTHSVLYPISRIASMPIGELVARKSPSSEWVSLSPTPSQRVLAGQEFTDSNLAWIEMPPGGWVEGDFHDAGQAPGEHAYAIYVKTARDAREIRIVSTSYSSPAY